MNKWIISVLFLCLFFMNGVQLNLSGSTFNIQSLFVFNIGGSARK